MWFALLWFIWRVAVNQEKAQRKMARMGRRLEKKQAREALKRAAAAGNPEW